MVYNFVFHNLVYLSLAADMFATQALLHVMYLLFLTSLIINNIFYVQKFSLSDTPIMQSFPTNYTPQNGYPTHGPYGPDGVIIEYLPSGNLQALPPQDTLQPQISYKSQITPPPRQPTGYNYHLQQQQMMKQYPPGPEFPSQPDYYSGSESKDGNVSN